LTSPCKVKTGKRPRGRRGGPWPKKKAGAGKEGGVGDAVGHEKKREREKSANKGGTTRCPREAVWLMPKGLN